MTCSIAFCVNSRAILRLYQSEPRKSDDGEICCVDRGEYLVDHCGIDDLVMSELQPGDQQRRRRHAAERQTQLLTAAVLLLHERRHADTGPIVGRQRAVAQINRATVSRHLAEFLPR